jgi:hypothetical protein
MVQISKTLKQNNWRAVSHRKMDVRFGGGTLEKQVELLAGVLPYKLSKPPRDEYN